MIYNYVWSTWFKRLIYIYFAKRFFLQKEAFLKNVPLDSLNLWSTCFWMVQTCGLYIYIQRTCRNMFFFIKNVVKFMIYIHFDGLSLWYACLYTFHYCILFFFRVYFFSLLFLFVLFLLLSCCLSLNIYIYISVSLFLLLILWLWSKRRERRKKGRERKNETKAEKEGKQEWKRFFVGGGLLAFLWPKTLSKRANNILTEGLLYFHPWVFWKNNKIITKQQTITTKQQQNTKNKNNNKNNKTTTTTTTKQ